MDSKRTRKGGRSHTHTQAKPNKTDRKKEMKQIHSEFDFKKRNMKIMIIVVFDETIHGEKLRNQKSNTQSTKPQIIIIIITNTTTTNNKLWAEWCAWNNRFLTCTSRTFNWIVYSLRSCVNCIAPCRSVPSEMNSSPRPSPPSPLHSIVSPILFFATS